MLVNLFFRRLLLK